MPSPEPLNPLTSLLFLNLYIGLDLMNASNIVNIHSFLSHTRCSQLNTSISAYFVFCLTTLNTRYSSAVSLAPAPTSSFSKFTDYCSVCLLCLWNQLHAKLGEPLEIQSLSCSPFITHSSSSSLSTSLAPSVFRSRFKTDELKDVFVEINCFRTQLIRPCWALCRDWACVKDENGH